MDGIIINRENNFRSIYIIGTQLDSFNICYFKEFFKWIGWFYRTDIDELMDVRLKENALHKFDYVLKFERTDKEDDCRQIVVDRVYRHVVRQMMEDVQCAEAKLSTPGQLLSEFVDNSLQLKDTIISNLLNIYIEKNLVTPLYEYTDLLLEKYEANRNEPEYRERRHMYQELWDTWTEVLLRLDAMEQSNPAMKQETFFACFQYARCHVKKKINDLCTLRQKLFQYPTEDLLQEIDQIYEYEPDSFRAEYLKACVAKGDIMYFSVAERHFHFCIEKCPKKFFKSIFLYVYGKCLADNGKLFEASRAYVAAYNVDPGNFKAVFKCATDAIRRNKYEDAFLLLKRLTCLWPSDPVGKMYVPLKEMEYAYKAYMLLARLDAYAKEKYESTGNEILNFVRNGSIGDGEESRFAVLLYSDAELRRLQYRLMYSRFDCVAKCVD